MCELGNDDHVALQQKAQRGLCRCFAVFGADFGQYGIGEKVLSALGKGTLGFMLNAVLFHIFMCGFLLMEHMGFDLVDGRRHPGKLTQVDEPVRVKV